MPIFRKHISSFDRELWMQDELKRSRCIRYIIKSNMTLGKTKEEIKKLFGQEGNYIPFNRWTYYIGKGILGSRYLVFYFREEKVSKVKIELRK